MTQNSYKNKTVLTLIIFLVLNHSSFSQKLMHGFGATISVLSGTVEGQGSTSSFTLAQTNFCYFPRYNFVEKDNSSISVGIPLGIGIGISSNTMGDDKGVSFAYDLPVVLDYNIGAKSTSENESTFGGYFGVGFGYYKVSISSSQYSNFTGASYGPMARAGVRISSESESWNGHGITIGLFYKKGMEKAKFNTFGFNVLYDL